MGPYGGAWATWAHMGFMCATKALHGYGLHENLTKGPKWAFGKVFNG